jgi:diguanylate cyclase (GGDEF)-like protein
MKENINSKILLEELERKRLRLIFSGNLAESAVISDIAKDLAQNPEKNDSLTDFINKALKRVFVGHQKEAVFDSSRLLVASHISDVKERYNLRLDDLTSLPKSRELISDFHILMDKIANKEIEEFSLVLLDLDHLKNINDTYGHSAGDMAIKSAADIFKEIIGEAGQVYRQGGDEFSALIEGSEEKVKSILEAIKLKLETDPIKIEDNRGPKTTIKISTSIGSVSSKRLGTEERRFDDISRIADIALYKAKENRGTIHQVKD